MHTIPSDEKYTDAIENNGQLRKRTRTPVLAPVVTHANPLTPTEVYPLELKFAHFRKSIKEVLPNAQFDKIFVNKDIEAECIVSGVCAGLRGLQSLESECFKFYIEDGRLIIRYIGEPVKTTSNLSKHLFLFIWIIGLLMTMYFVFTNLERYKRFLE